MSNLVPGAYIEIEEAIVCCVSTSHTFQNEVFYGSLQESIPHCRIYPCGRLENNATISMTEGSIQVQVVVRTFLERADGLTEKLSRLRFFGVCSDAARLTFATTGRNEGIESETRTLSQGSIEVNSEEARRKRTMTSTISRLRGREAKEDTHPVSAA